jgi:hypothetical protein
VVSGRFVIRATRERGVGVPPSRSLATASREASSVYARPPTTRAAATVCSVPKSVPYMANRTLNGLGMTRRSVRRTVDSERERGHVHRIVSAGDDDIPFDMRWPRLSLTAASRERAPARRADCTRRPAPARRSRRYIRTPRWCASRRNTARCRQSCDPGTSSDHGYSVEVACPSISCRCSAPGLQHQQPQASHSQALSP